MTKISVLIPTHKSVDSLNLCLESCIKGASNLDNVEILIGVDGTYNTVKDVLKTWDKYINILKLDENIGLPRLTNLLVYNASEENILIVNDDNVFDFEWDKRLIGTFDTKNTVISINQIEPFPSMFSQFHIKDLGRDPKTFDLENFWNYSKQLDNWYIKEEGSTLPIYMNRLDFIKIGGWNELYPSTGIVCDWDFFLKCQLNGFKMIRTKKNHFYHFVSLSAKTPEQQIERQKQEIEAHNLAKYIWGDYIKHNPETNLKYL